VTEGAKEELSARERVMERWKAKREDADRMFPLLLEHLTPHYRSQLEKQRRLQDEARAQALAEREAARQRAKEKRLAEDAGPFGVDESRARKTATKSIKRKGKKQ